MMPGLPTVAVTLTRYGAVSVNQTTGLPSATPTTSLLTVIEEPWKPNAQPQRPEGVTSDDSRLFVCFSEVLGVQNQGTSTARWADRITATSGTWQVAEVVIAPAMPGIAAAWHAYCLRVRPGDEP